MFLPRTHKLISEHVQSLEATLLTYQLSQSNFESCSSWLTNVWTSFHTANQHVYPTSENIDISLEEFEVFILCFNYLNFLMQCQLSSKLA